MIRRAASPHRDFLVVHNDVVRDERLSYRARGLLVAILSRPDDWRTDSTHLAREAKEGRDAVRAALNELEATGYLVRTPSRDEKGQWVTETVIYDTPQGKTAGQPGDWKPGVGESGVGEPGAIQSTDTKNREESVVECPAPPSSARARQGFTDWQAEDEQLLRSIMGDHIDSDGTKWALGTHVTPLWWEAFRKSGIDWPGRYFAAMEERGGGGGAVDEHLAAQGLSRAQW